MMNTTKLLLIFLIIVNFKQVICSTLKDWRDSLNDYLSYELKKYQIIFIVENEKILRDFDLIDIFPNALSPSLMFTFEGIKEILSPENELLQNSAYTSFFILIFASEIIDYESISTFLVDRSFFRKFRMMRKIALRLKGAKQQRFQRIYCQKIPKKPKKKHTKSLCYGKARTKLLLPKTAYKFTLRHLYKKI